LQRRTAFEIILIEKTDLSENVVRMVLTAPVIAQKRKAGQFIILKNR